MKKIYKNKTNRILSLVLGLAVMVALGVFMQSCSSEDFESNDKISNATKYLDLNVKSNKEFTPAELEILVSAIQRASKYLVFDGEEYLFTLESAKKINISDRLFDYIYPSMQNMRPNTTGIPRLKSTCETTSGWGWTQTKCTVSDAEMIQICQALINTAGQTSHLMSWIALAVSKVPLLAAAVTIYAQAISAQGMTISNSYDDYINNSNRKGGTFIETNVMVPNAGYVTTYQFCFE